MKRVSGGPATKLLLLLAFVPACKQWKRGADELLLLSLHVPTNVVSYALLAGYQALLFAPTELLAGQHYKTLERLAEELPMRLRPRVGMLVGSSGGAAKKQLKAEIASGEKNVIISTQAALWVNEWAKLALVVVDEQHK